MIGRIKTWLAIAGAFVLAMFGVYAIGRRDQATKERAKDAQDALDTRKRIDEADHFDGDPHVARDFLRNRKP